MDKHERIHHSARLAACIADPAALRSSIIGSRLTAGNCRSLIRLTRAMIRKVGDQRRYDQLNAFFDAVVHAADGEKR